MTRNRRGGLVKTDSSTNYKRAVVGLTEPFHYPDDIDEMDRDERELEKRRLEFKFSIERRKEMYKRQFLELKSEKRSTLNRAGASGKLRSVSLPSSVHISPSDTQSHRCLSFSVSSSSERPSEGIRSSRHSESRLSSSARGGTRRTTPQSLHSLM